MRSPGEPLDGPALEQLVRLGQERWPGVRLDPSALGAHLAALGGAVTPDDRALADLVLAAACVRGDPAALGHLEREILRPVGAFIASVDRSPEFADEVRQALRLRLLGGGGQPPALASYRGESALGGWVRVAALRIALNLRRGERTQASAERRAEDPLATRLAPELAHLQARYREPFTRALEEALTSLGDRDRALLRLYHAEELPLEQIGALYRVHLSTVSRWLTRARQSVADRTLELLRERLE
ncbi:MAG: sigma-70 family RNA polymerase sigma factor, partial [Myxococcaceae bacterium]